MSFTIRKERKKDYRQGLRVIFVDDAVLHKSLLLHSTWDALSFRFRVFVNDKRTERICTDKNCTLNADVLQSQRDEQRNGRTDRISTAILHFAKL